MRAKRSIVGLLAVVVVGVTAGSAISATAAGSDSTGPLTPAQLKGQTLVVASWGGGWTAATQKYFLQPFAKKYGVKVVVQNSGTGFLTPTITQEKTGNVQWDLLDSAGNATAGLNVLKYTESYPSWLVKSLTADSSPGTVHSYFVQYGNSAIVIACNPAMVTKCPTNAKQFFDVKNYPGPRAVDVADPASALQYAEQAMGVARYSMVSLDLSKAFGYLNKFKPNVAVWTTSGSQMVQVMADKTAAISIMWASRLNSLKQQIPNVKVYWASATTDSEGWVVPKNAPHKDVAFAFIDWWGKQQANQAAWLKEIGAVVPGKDVPKLVSKETAASLPAAHGVHAVPAFDNWGAIHSQEIAKGWLSFLAGTKQK